MAENYNDIKNSSIYNLLDSGEKEFIAENPGIHRVSVTDYFASLAGREKSDPLRRQFIPEKKELVLHEYETADPLCESKYKAGRRIIRRYPDRVLFLVTSRCAMYCRHCFRRYLTGSDTGDFSDDDIRELTDFITYETGIREILLSGGDPLMLDNERIAFLLGSIRNARPDIIIRVGSRIPVVLPSRIDSTLVSVFSKNRPLYIFTQFNHHREVAEKSISCIESLLTAGIPVFNQTVLLKGINDSEDLLEMLFRKLVFSGVKPYYLFQGDLAEGTSHFRVPLKRGLEIMANLSKRMSGLSLPVYAVDLPGGGGKVRLNPESIICEEKGFFKIRSYDGTFHYYPDESLF